MGLATCLSFFFFALSVKEQPYNAQHLNVVKIYSKIQLFGIMLILVVLQTDSKGLATQLVGADGYGIVSVVLVLTIVPISGYMIVRALKTARDEALELKLELEATISKVDNLIIVPLDEACMESE